MFKPGGTLVGVRGTMAGRVINTKTNEDRDPLGQWTVTYPKGKSNSIIVVISVHQVYKGGSEEATAYLQQQADCYKKYKKVINQRDQLCKDLIKVLKRNVEKNHKIILCADINDDASIEFDNQWNCMIFQVGMRNIHEEKQKGILPRGRRMLDMIAVSGNINNNNSVIRAKILVQIITLMKDLTNEVKPDVIKHIVRRFMTKNAKKRETYVNTLTTLCREAKIGEKVNNMMMRVKKHLENLKQKEQEIGTERGKEKDESLNIEKVLQKIDTKRYQLMIAVEKKVEEREV